MNGVLAGQALHGGDGSTSQAIERARELAACNIMSRMVAAKNAERPPGDRCAVAGPRPAKLRSSEVGLYAADGGRKYLNQAERQRALAVMATLDPSEALFAMTLAWTGARVSEVLALTPASFQVESGVVAFTTLKRRRLSVREVPVPDSLIAAVSARFDLAVRQLDPLLASKRLWPWHRVTAWRIIKEVMRRGGITGRPACPRGLRHGFGVGTLQSGVPLNLIQRWLGHARISTTAIYADASGPEERAIASKFWQAS